MGTRLAVAFKSVLLPAPLGPRMDVTSPKRAVKDTPDRARREPYETARSDTRTATSMSVSLLSRVAPGTRGRPRDPSPRRAAAPPGPARGAPRRRTARRKRRPRRPQQGRDGG